MITGENSQAEDYRAVRRGRNNSQTNLTEAVPLPKLMQKGFLPEAATSSTSGIGGSAGMFGPLDMTCGWPLVNTMT